MVRALTLDLSRFAYFDPLIINHEAGKVFNDTGLKVQDDSGILTIDKLNGSLSNSPILNFQIAGFYQYAQICIQSVIGNPELSLLIEKVPSMNNELPPNSYELIFSDSYDPFGDLFYSNNVVSDCTPITLEGLPIQTVKPQFSNMP